MWWQTCLLVNVPELKAWAVPVIYDAEVLRAGSWNSLCSLWISQGKMFLHIGRARVQPTLPFLVGCCLSPPSLPLPIQASFHSLDSEVLGSFHKIFKNLNLRLGYRKSTEVRRGSKQGQTRRDGDFHLVEHLTHLKPLEFTGFYKAFL